MHAKNLLIPFIFLFPLHIYASNVHTLDDLPKNSSWSSFYASRDQNKKDYTQALLKANEYYKKKDELKKLERELVRECRLKDLKEPTAKSQKDIDKIAHRYETKKSELKEIYEKVNQQVESKYPSSGLKGYFKDWEKRSEKQEKEYQVWSENQKKEYQVWSENQKKESEAYWQKWSETQEKEHQGYIKKITAEHQVQMQHIEDERQLQEKEHQAYMNNITAENQVQMQHVEDASQLQKKQTKHIGKNARKPKKKNIKYGCNM